jgi:hypothetical protein
MRAIRRTTQLRPTVSQCQGSPSASRKLLAVRVECVDENRFFDHAERRTARSKL